ncbi:hypothetical protein ACFYL6_01455 [Micromonospora sp. NPDC007208]|uniref:hypothetical protein n=1 Tax=Micromonospora sp. NPDC007208 TaxID=3364236 RepID=UPI0036B5A057
MTWTEPATWYANLASFYAAAAAFITDPAGDVLLVKPTYRDHWAFPGGYVDEANTRMMPVPARSEKSWGSPWWWVTFS